MIPDPSTAEWALIVALVLARLLVPLLIPRFELLILVALVLDAIDNSLLAAFTDGSPGPGSLGTMGFTVSNFEVLFTGSALIAALNSALVGLGASILALVIGGGMAFLAARTNVPGRKLIYFFGMVVNIALAATTRFKYINLSGHVAFYIAAMIAVILGAGTRPGPDAPTVASLHLTHACPH